MAEPDENDLPSTRTWSGPNDAEASPAPRLSDSAVEGLLNAPRPRRVGGWEPPTLEALQASLPQYEIRALLGRGGMGAVYQGWQRSLDRFVAIKILPPSLESAHHEFAARFKREAKAMARLKHPGIIPVHDAGETPDGLLYFVMDYVSGIDAQKLLSAEGRLPTEKALTIVSRVLEALAYAHEHGIIHRDIKPANIMIDEDGRVQIADFGLARSLSAESSLLTGSQVAMGTPDYMAPESRLSVAGVDHRADLYAVGVMLYRMLTGKLPHGRFQAPSLVVPALDKRLDRIVDRALEPDCEARYSSATELRHDLEPILTRARRRGAPRASGPGSGRRGLWVGVAAVIILAGAAFCFVATKIPHVSATSFPAAKTASTPSREAPAIRLWDEPQKLPSLPGIRWEDNAVRLDHGWLVLEGASSRDVIFRARVRMNREALSPKLSVRGKGGTEEQQQQYSLGIDAREKKVLLTNKLHGEQHVLQTWPFQRDYSPDEWAQLELRAIGGELTVSLDGMQLGAVHDDSVLQSGQVMLSANAAGFFRDIVYIPFDTAPVGLRLWDKPEKIPTVKGVSWEGNALRLEGAPATFANPADRGDVFFRAQVRMNPEAISPSLDVRVGGDKQDGSNRGYALGIPHGASRFDLAVFTGAQRRVLASWPFPRTYEPDEWVELGLRAVGDELIAFLDGRPLGAVHDSSIPREGHVMLYAIAAGYFRNAFYYSQAANNYSPAANVSSTAPFEPGALRLWDKPEKIPAVKGVTWEHNALHIESNAVSDTATLADVFFRARVRMNPEAVNPSLSVRRDGSFQDQSHHGYSLAIIHLASEFNLTVFTGDQHRVLASWPFPRTYGPDEWVELGLRAVGGELTASLDGQTLGVVRDSSIPRQGHVMLYAGAAGYFRDAVVIPLGQGANGSSAAILEPGSLRLWDKAEKIPAMKGVSLEANALHLDDAAVTFVNPADRGDVFFRAQVRMNPEATSAQIDVRVSGNKPDGSNRNYLLGVLHQASRFDLAVISGGQRRVLGSWPFPRAYGPDEWVQLGLRAVGDELTASLDGQVLGVVHDSSIPREGQVMLYAGAAGYFRDAIYTSLAKPTASSPAPAANPVSVEKAR